MKIPFGSNLLWIDAACTQGYVQSYHLYRKQANDNFKKMADNGQTLAKIVMMLWDSKENYIADDPFTIGLYDVQMDLRRIANLQDMVSDLKSAGFQSVEYVIGFEGNTLSPFQWSGDLGTRWEKNATFIMNLRNIVRQFPLPYGILHGGDDIFDNTNPIVTAYAQTLWTWYTTALTQMGEQKDLYFGIPENPKSIQNVPLIYRGTDPNGAVNWPTRFPIACYGNGPAFQTAYETLCGILDELDGVEAPPAIPYSVSETLSFSDNTNTIHIIRARQDCLRECIGINQWPIIRKADGTSMNYNPTLEGILCQ